MRGLRFLFAVLAAFTVAACGGGGGGTAPRGGPPVTQTPQRSASLTMALAIPIRKQSTRARARAPRFVSPGLQSLALYDGSQLVYVANVDLSAGSQTSGAVRAPRATASTAPSQFTTFYAAPNAATTVTPGSCSNTGTTETCTITLTTTAGRHIFGLVAYPTQQTGTPPPDTGGDPGSPVTLNGIISSEGEVTLNLVGGTNPGATLTMLGVASNAFIRSDSEEVELPYNTPTQFSYQVLDSAYAQILTPGDYDNGPVTFTSAPAGVLSIAPSSVSTPPSQPGDQTVTVTCTQPAGGSATVVMSANSKPNASYASSLVYSRDNYFDGGILATLSISCDPIGPIF